MEALTDKLCLQCGLCCNGVLFADVRSEPGERSPLLAGRARVVQPCPAFQAGDCTCAIYLERPRRCRQFECRQLLGTKAGKFTVEAAMRRITKVRRLAAKAEKMLVELGFDNVKKPLKQRFQQCQRAAEQGKLAENRYATLADLQLAMHRLTSLLAEDFYG